MFFRTNKQLRRELAATQARLRMIEATIARERDTIFDNPTYAKGYRDALQSISGAVLITRGRRVKNLPTRARQSRTTVLTGPPKATPVVEE